MATPSTDFLKFNAYQIKDLIVRKLSEDTKFTDQVYEGSNLNILIDLVSYMFQAMMYSLNNAASESMFADTMLYENISRLCRFIGYNPRGFMPASTQFYLENPIDASKSTEMTSHRTYEGMKIPKYARIDTGKTDSRGNKIYYSTVENWDIHQQDIFPFTVYNGKWVMHSDVFVSNGGAYQTFVLDGVKSDANEGRFVSNDHIHVYVMDKDGNIDQWKMDRDEIFLNTSTKNVTDKEYGSIYTSEDMMYTVRLNEDKTYEIKFGNGILGRIPEEGNKIYVFYLEGNGPEGAVFQGDVPEATLEHDASMFGMPKHLYGSIFGVGDVDETGYRNGEWKLDGDHYSDDNGKWVCGMPVSIYMNSTGAAIEESVPEIRESAPAYFKYGNRLITRNDYEYFVKRNYTSDIVDVKCHNTIEYGTSFLKWLYHYGKSGLIRRMTGTQDSRHYLKANRMRRYGYQYADPADADNIFLWVKTYPDINNQEVFLRNLQSSIQSRASDMKTLTHEITVLQNIDVNFVPCAAFDEYVLQTYILGNEDIATTDKTLIEVTLEDNSIYVNANIKSAIVDIIFNYFDYRKCTLGMKVDYNEILGQILSMNGVQRIRTVFINGDEEIIKNGLSFATWSDRFLEPGDDLQVSNSMRILEPFQFPRLDMTKDQLSGMIKIIRRSLSNTSTIKY